ncbi:MAG: response regulator [Candidatus Hydrogenedens sp.]
MDSEEFLKIFNEAIGFASIGLVRYRMNGEIIFIDRNALKLFEVDSLYSSPEEVIGKNISDLQKYILPPGSIRKKLQEEGSLKAFEYPLETIRGRKKWFLHYSYLTRDERLQEDCIQVILQDITELKETKLNLEWALNRFDAILNTVNKIAIQSFDKDYNVILWNKYSESLYGIRAKDIKNIDDLRDCYSDYQIKTLKSHLDQLFNGKRINGLFLWDIRNKRGEEKWIHFTLMPVIRENKIDEVICIQIDTTEEFQQRKERDKVLAQMEHVRRLESIGVLASGIAHEFNNILMGIMGHAELALMNSENLPKRIQDNLEQIRKSTERAAKLTRQLLTYSGKERESIQVFDFNDMVNHTVDTFYPSLHRGVRFLQQLHPNLPLVEGDSSQIHQSISHLLVNALEALPTKGGTITVQTGKKTLSIDDLQNLHFADKAQPGDYVFISISDTGCGIKEEDMERIFEPFFSSKFLGRGLGLASVSGVIRTHKGAIKVESKIGQGSTFTLFFPCFGSHRERTFPEKALILIIDDEEDVQKFFSVILQKEGYEVISAINGIEGIEKVKIYREQIQLIILDIKMPGLNGIETLRQIRKILSDVPVIISTGYSEDSINTFDPELKINDFLTKPFGTKDILQKIKICISNPHRK